MRQVIEFNRGHPANRFDGIHLDIEPQQRPENKGPGNLRFLPGLADAFIAVRVLAESAGMTVNADIQNKLLKGDVAQRRMLLSSVPRVTLMMYELSSPDDGQTAEQKADKADGGQQEIPRPGLRRTHWFWSGKDGDSPAHTGLWRVASPDAREAG